MGSMSIWHWAIVLIVVLVLFGGGGKITTIMGDMARGIKAFKKNLSEEDPQELKHDKSQAKDASFHQDAKEKEAQSAGEQKKN